MRIVAVGGGTVGSNKLAAAPDEIKEIVGPGFECEVMPNSFTTFTINQAHRKMSEIATMESGLRAASGGADAIFIPTVGDYALHDLRSALRIPVVGAGEATMHVALTLGRRFSIVTIWPPAMLFLYKDLLRLYAMETHCMSIRCVAQDAEIPTLKDDENFYTAMRSGERTLEDRIVHECNRALEEDDADVVILGCTCMSPIAKTIASRVTAPVLNPMTVGYKYAEFILGLGECHSERAYPTVPVSTLDRLDAASTAIAGIEKGQMRQKVASQMAAE